MGNKVKLPIRQLVEFILRSGDIDSRYVEKDRMYEGARAHRSLQKSNASVYNDYKGEVPLSAEIHHKEIVYTVEGRADGIFSDGGKTVIDEIKTTVVPAGRIDEGFNAAHWAQAKCYAYIVAAKGNLAEISVQLTYYNLDTGDIKRFIRAFEFQELERFLFELIEKYSVWASFTAGWAEIRDETIKKLAFPFPAYRKGQRKLAVHTYRAIDQGKKLFALAPTGTGKTISTLFPAAKAIGEGKTAKIFYLTAKTITRQAAEDAFQRMRAGGLRLKTLTITAKEKICFCDKALCYPERCEYAKGHYDRINGAILDAITNCDDFSRTTIEEYARKHEICPFELSLDIALWVDCVICDYNYVFDPRAYLRRFFAESRENYVFIIDEAHNLADRAREMFSAELSKAEFLKIKKDFKDLSKPLNRALNAINKYMLTLKSNCGEKDHFISADKPEELLKILARYTEACELLIKENRELGTDAAFLSQYFQALNFMQTADFYSDAYVTFVEKQRGEVRIKLFCLDPSFLLGEALKRGRSAVMFSATLTPLEYFRELLSGGEEDGILAVDSPFESKNLCLMAADHISTKFQDRQQNVGNITGLIGSFISAKTGNYIVYFPSYKYMHDVFSDFVLKYPDIAALEQEPDMTEDKREAFLSSFKENPLKTVAGFCVLGGIFSEGIDLKGDRLIGAVIVGVGLPQLNVQQNIIRDYFARKNGRGYEYAYMYPGMNKVLQAAGRVIRSEEDRGAILLIDERFSHNRYRRLFPKHWRHCKTIRNAKRLEILLHEFWTGIE